MELAALARRIGVMSLVMGLLLAAPAHAQPDDSAGSVAARPSESKPSGSSEPTLPDPASFDPATTTDTEVARLRLRVMVALLEAQVADRAATDALQNARADRADRQAERDSAREGLGTIRATLATTVIDGFVIDTAIDVGDIFLPSLEGETTATRAGDTARQLLANRAAAEIVLVQAEAALAEAGDAVTEAGTAKVTALEALLSVGEDVEQFEERVGEQQALAEAADAEAAAVSDEVALQSVAGTLHVNADIEADIDRLISDAREDGIDFGGGSYRTFEAQIELRLAHCGGSVPPDLVAPLPDALPEEIAAYEAAVVAWTDYVIYEVPAGSCSPPTATPGNSEHQQGLAIDFTENGATLTASSPGFAWLVEHGADYGLINLPSESWHWSTTGS